MSRHTSPTLSPSRSPPAFHLGYSASRCSSRCSSCVARASTYGTRSHTRGPTAGAPEGDASTSPLTHRHRFRRRLVAGSVELESVGLRGIILNGRLTSLRKPPMAALMAPATPPRHACLRPSTSVERRGEQARPAALHSFICPITHEIMRDPVVAADGHSYERAAISQWLSRGCTPGTLHRSPCTNLPLQHARLTPNHSLRCAISEWRHCER